MPTDIELSHTSAGSGTVLLGTLAIEALLNIVSCLAALSEAAVQGSSPVNAAFKSGAQPRGNC